MWVSFAGNTSDVLPKERGRGSKQKVRGFQDFPGSPAVEAPCFHCRGIGWISGQGTNICLLHSVSSVQFRGSVMSDSVTP